MAGTTNFLVFNEANDTARTFNDSEYNEATQRLNGVTPGMAISRLHNKLYLQTSAMARAIAEAITANGDDCMDNDIPAITASFVKLIEDTAKSVSDNEAIGIIKMFSSNSTLPAGYLLCDGAAINRTTYADLFGAIGTTYGAGDGSTTFNLPNYTGGTFPEGASTAGTVHNAGLPNISGQFRIPKYANGTQLVSDASGCVSFVNSASQQSGMQTNLTNQDQTYVKYTASASSSIYSDSVTTVQPKAITIRFIIKAYEE